MPAPTRPVDATDLVWRLRRVLSMPDLDCQGRASLEGALNRLTSLEYRRLLRRALADAREHKDQIVARLAFLAEIDEIIERDADRAVLDEMAMLFDEIGAASAQAAQAIRSIGSFARSPRLIGQAAGEA